MRINIKSFCKNIINNKFNTLKNIQKDKNEENIVIRNIQKESLNDTPDNYWVK